jgi:hypothetical protein
MAEGDDECLQPIRYNIYNRYANARPIYYIGRRNNTAIYRASLTTVNRNKSFRVKYKKIRFFLPLKCVLVYGLDV